MQRCGKEGCGTDQWTGFARFARIFLVATVILLVLADVFPVFAAEAHVTTRQIPSEVLLLFQIVLLIVTGRLLGEALQRIGLPSVMGQFLSGVLLGPSIFGLIWPEAERLVFPPDALQRAMLDAVSQVGVLLILFLAGMETDLALVSKVKRAAVSVSLVGIAFPFAAGFLLGQSLPDRLLPDPGLRVIASLFLGTALSISSLKIVAAVVREMDFARRNVGQIILASAMIDDTLGWVMIAIILGLARHGVVDGWEVARNVLGTLLFLALSLGIGPRLVFKIIRLTNDHFISEAAVIAAILAVMGSMALITHAVGVHTVLGAFVAGILVGKSPILTEKIDQQIRGLTAALFMPVFFGAAGLHTDLTILKDPHLLLLTGGMIIIASVGKAAGAFTGGWLGGLQFRESVALAAGMNARGSTEVIVATIGLSMGLMSQNIFTMLVTMAFVTTFLMPPTLRWALGRLTLGGEEKSRLEKEAFEEKAFVSAMERVLLTVDQSQSGKLATRLAGLLAGRRGLPVTVLPLPSAKWQTPKDAERVIVEDARDVVQEAARQAGDAGEEERPAPVEVTAPVHDLPPAEAVETEARKGYDLLMIGMEPARAPEGGFDRRLSEISKGFEGPLGIVIARGIFAENPLDKVMEIVVPITGSGPSLRGMDVALNLAEAASAPITALAIASVVAQSESEGRHARRDDSEILREIRRMAKYFNVDVRPMKGEDDIQKAIRKAVSEPRRCLIVLGASRRPGEPLSFGPLAAGLLEESEQALLLISS